MLLFNYSDVIANFTRLYYTSDSWSHHQNSQIKNETFDLVRLISCKFSTCFLFVVKGFMFVIGVIFFFFFMLMKNPITRIIII